MNKSNHSYVKSGTEKHLKNSDFESESEKSLQISQADSGYDETSLQKPDFILKPHSVEVTEGQSAIFLCRTIGNPPPKIVWKKQGEIIDTDSRHKITYGDDCILEIKRTTSKDSGSYSCVLTNSAGTVTMETKLVVKVTNPQPEAPSDFRSVLRKTSKQEDLQTNKVENSKTKVSAVGDRINKVNSTPVNSEKEFIRSRFNLHNQNSPDSNSPGKIVQNFTESPSKISNSSLSEKIGKFQKLENKSPQSPQRFDFRSVLKTKHHEESKVKSKMNSLDSTDGAKKTNFQDAFSARRQPQQREVTLSKPKSLHEGNSPSWKSQTPLKKSVENLHKTFSENSVKSKEEKIDYRSVLKRKENVFVAEEQKFLSMKPNRIKTEPQKEVNNNNDIKSEISPLRNDFSSENTNERQSAGSRVNDKNIRSDDFKTFSSEKLSKNGPTLKTNVKKEIDIQHVLSQRDTKLEQQHQGKNDKTSPLDFKDENTSNETSSHTSKQNEHQKNSSPFQQEKFSSFSLKTQKQPLEAEKTSPNETYANRSVQKPEMCSNLEKVTSSTKHVNFKVSKNVKHNETKEENKIVTQRNTENSVLGHNVSSDSKSDQKMSSVEEKGKELAKGQQKQSAAFESSIKYDIKEDYKNILTKRKSDVNLTEKQSKELKAIEKTFLMGDRKKDEERTTSKFTSKNEVTVGSDNFPSTSLKSKSSNTAVTNKDEVKGGKSKLQSINGSYDVGKSNLNTIGSDKKINDSNIQWEEPRSVLKRRRSSSSFNKFDKISPTGLDQIDLAETLTRQPPLFKTTIHDQSVKEGESVTMECHVTGVPKPEIIWYMKDSQIKPSKFFRMTYEDNFARLVIAGAYPEDIGTYTCTATNSSGTERCSCHLFVQECSSTTSNNQSDEDTPPETPTQKAPYDLSKSKDIIDEKDQKDKKNLHTPSLKVPYINEINPTNQTAVVGQKAVIRGLFTSGERPEVKWYKGQKEIHTCAAMNTSTTGSNSTLTINKVQPSDGGKYQLVVENSSGCVSAVASIDVQDVPEPPVGKPYASEVSLHSVILSWCGPAYDGGSQVTGYKVEICKAEEETWDTLTHSCHSTSFSVDNLEAHTPYFFRVSAKNRHGLSKPSDMSSVVVTKDRRISVRLSVESDDVFLTSPTSSGSLVSPFSPDEDLPFSPRVINISTDRKFEDDYDLKDDLGKGKFGKVSKCTEKSTGRIFAAKVIKCRSSKDKENIRQEVEIMNQLTHPKLVLLWDAFETAKSMVLVLELVAGGELFDRVVDEDLDLTERDCVHFVRQICDGVQYMHTKSIMHLDLKPENILCVNKESNLIKIIDFGLARPCKEEEGLRVMFGTPEFIAPEVVNYEVIGLPTDIWSLGVICYVLLSGLSPFMGDSDVETLSNVTRGDFDFDDEAFEEISDHAKEFIETTLQKNKQKRPTIAQCLEHKWLAQAERNSSKKLRQSLRNLKQFMARRKWQKMGNAIRAVGRMSSAMQKLQKSRSDSASSVQSDGSDTINSQSDTAKIPSQPSSTMTSSEDKSSDKMTSQTETVKETPATYRNANTERSVIPDTSVRAKTNLEHRQMDYNETSSKYENMFSKPVHKIHPNPNTFHDINQTDCDNTFETKKQIQNDSFSKRKELKFLKEMIDSEAFEGDIVRFDIQISGDNKPSVEWYYEDTLIKEDRQHTFSYVNSENGEFSLIIRNVREKNEGEYMCKVFNSSQELTCFADLTILGAGAF